MSAVSRDRGALYIVDSLSPLCCGRGADGGVGVGRFSRIEEPSRALVKAIARTTTLGSPWRRIPRLRRGQLRYELSARSPRLQDHARVGARSHARGLRAEGRAQAFSPAHAPGPRRFETHLDPPGPVHELSIRCRRRWGATRPRLVRWGTTAAIITQSRSSPSSSGASTPKS